MFTELWVLLAIQIFLGGFDTLYHHELTERLAWRDSQAGELKLHAARNLIYVVLFAGLAVFEPGGLVAAALIVFLVIELGITLRDFVEEDMTRKLPVTERLLHTVITANYGAVLALLLPVLWGWTSRETGLVPLWYGLWSVMCLGAAIGVLIFGIRDALAARRLARLTHRPAKCLIPKAPVPKTILITGGTGFIGRKLVAALRGAGHRIIVLTRDAENCRLGAPVTLLESLDDIHEQTQIDHILNLAGEPIADRFWTHAQKQKMLMSRINVTRDVIALIDRLERKPESLVSGSAIGIYGAGQDVSTVETTPINMDCSFSQKLCVEWEAEAAKAEELGVRLVTLRTGIVLDRDGGTLARMLVPTELGGGAVLGSGQQWMSWISRDDIIRLIAHILNNPNLRGPVNATAPTPVRNKVFTQALARALYRPVMVKIPMFVLKCLGGLGTEILMGSQNILPHKAQADGFEFLDTDIQKTLNVMLGRKDPSKTEREFFNYHSPGGKLA